MEYGEKEDLAWLSGLAWEKREPVELVIPHIPGSDRENGHHAWVVTDAYIAGIAEKEGATHRIGVFSVNHAGLELKLRRFYFNKDDSRPVLAVSDVRLVHPKDGTSRVCFDLARCA